MMRYKVELLAVVLVVALGAFYFFRLTPTEPAGPSHPTPIVQGVLPDQQITEVARVRMVTDKGELILEVYPQAAPGAAKRFLELVDLGFYDNTPIFRVVDRFVAQFGINPQFEEWKERFFDDDPSLYALDRGTVAFAKAGPNTNSTQVFINFDDNSRLRKQGGFTAFGRVTQGMGLADRFAKVGSPGMGLDQERLWQDTGYLATLDVAPTMILKIERIP